MGIKWTDPVVITRTSKVFGAFTMVLTGVALWDVLSTLWFEWQILTGKRKWKWPMTIYFIARFAMLSHIFAITINRNALSEVPCKELTFMSKFCDAVGTCASSLILVLRTRAVWHRDRKVTLLMGLLFLGQIAVWSQTFRFSKAQWNPMRMLCDVLSTAPRMMMVGVWGYTMIFDFIILVVCAYQLISHVSSTLGKVLLRDGIAYFCAAFVANLLQTIFAGLQLNPVMNIMFLPFALVVSVIAATTVFRNVFTAYDAFSNDTGHSGHSGHSSSRLGEGSVLRTGARILFKHNTTMTTKATSENEISLAGYSRKKSDVEAGVASVQKGEERDGEDHRDMEVHGLQEKGQAL
ncbi:hypothetical protein NLJ89_g8494 [Agrocybe chaxingu]|uniref:Transmembrane protein n=1 Tax=Agrocybe chaxingu TaxID=84603 RepID=A0A9W8K2C7_9AGAR|nr:hypothetical protein NLJ89_g8494 [Agrocybe chaxingu]